MTWILNTLIAAAAFAISPPAHAAQDFDACVAFSVEGSAGTVESVREVAPPRDLHAFDAEVLEHHVRPESAEELVVRLDAGPLVVLSERRAHWLFAGQRVRVHHNGSLLRVEKEPLC
jgi:hypothetical protein